MAGPMTWNNVQLQNECLSLQTILQAFDAPISEQYAWAIVYQSLKCLDMILEATDSSTPKYVVLNLAELLLHKDGYIHSDSYLQPGQNRKVHSATDKTVAEIAMVVYEALDHNIEKNQQRKLDTDLENLLEEMVNNVDDEESDDEGGDIDDEGIEDCDGGKELTEKVIEICKGQLAFEEEADSHYASVCRALVAEVLELSSFMDKIRKNNVGSEEGFMNLDPQIWSSIWQQMMGELRNGIKLKKVNYSKTATEFGLTPYEVLMGDIRQKKWELSPVTLNPQVKHDARNVILDFIRSRPPLKPASERILPPRRKESTPVEQLMEDIRSEKSRTSLRKTTKETKSKPSHLENKKESVKKKLEIDEEEMNSLLNFDDDSLDSANTSVEIGSPESSDRKHQPELNCSSKPPKSILNKTAHSVGFSVIHLEKEKQSPHLCDKKKPPRIRDTVDSQSEPLQPSELTFQEFCHIKRKMKQASIDCDETEDDLKKELEKGKLCFSCKITVFGLFFNKPACCTICKAKICSKCLHKVKLPSSEISDFPLSSLISILGLDKSNKVSPLNQPVIGLTRNRFGSLRAPREKHPFNPSQDHQAASLPGSPVKKAQFSSLTRSATSLALTAGLKQTTELQKIPPPAFHRSKTMSRAEAASRKSILQQQALASSSIQQDICLDCKEALSMAVLKESNKSKNRTN